MFPCPPDQHISELGKLAVLLVLHLNEAPLGLTAEHLLAAHRDLAVTADHRKWNVLLGGAVQRLSEKCVVYHCCEVLA